MKNIEAGSFHEGESGFLTVNDTANVSDVKKQNKKKKKDNLDFSFDYSNVTFDVRELKKDSDNYPNFETALVEEISLFKESFNPKADVIYYPCSEFDLSVGEVFPNSRIIYVDINYEVFEALKDKGLEAHHASALEFNPGDVDILFLFNPQIEPDIPVSFVKSGGYVMCNDWHSTAQKLKQNKEFQPIGIIKRDDDGVHNLITEDIDDYLELAEDVDINDSLKIKQTKRKKENLGGDFIFKKI